jgi:HTH-type transcriptional regulator/antitoxin HigA
MKSRTTSVKPIKSEKDYEKALARIEKLMDARPNSAEGDLLEVLSTLVEAYEREHYPIPPPDPIDAIKYRMERLGMTTDELGKMLGSKARANEILRGKRKLTLPVMRVLHSKLGVDAGTLLSA